MEVRSLFDAAYQGTLVLVLLHLANVMESRPFSFGVCVDAGTIGSGRSTGPGSPW
jgi:hypothetical protein